MAPSCARFRTDTARGGPYRPVGRTFGPRWLFRRYRGSMRSSPAPSPVAWATLVMRECNDLDGIGHDPIDEAERKPMENDSPRSVDGFRPPLWRLSQSADCAPKLGEKRPFRALAPSGVPETSSPSLLDSLRVELKAMSVRHRGLRRSCPRLPPKVRDGRFQHRGP